MVNSFLKKRRSRKRIDNTKYKQFSRGDILSITYRLCGFGFVFTGICVFLRKKKMVSTNTTFMLRNIFVKVGVELSATLYGLCRLNIKLLDYARKKFNYRSSKLFYLRNKLNRESWVK